MLLLVLILVLIAFGLLVVALLSGSVLWAWVSVGVSVAAAGVLLVDWLQRRSAVRAGDDAATLSEEPPASVDIEPVTDFIPIVPAPEPAPGGPAADPVAAEGSVADGPGGVPASKARFDDASAAQRTFVMLAKQPSGQPSGSAARPSGAEADVTSSSGNSSPRVTDSGSASPGQDPPDATVDGSGEAAPDVPGGRPASEHTGAAQAPKTGSGRSTGSDAEATLMVDIRKRRLAEDAASAGPPKDLAATAAVASGGPAIGGPSLDRAAPEGTASDGAAPVDVSEPDRPDGSVRSAGTLAGTVDEAGARTGEEGEPPEEPRDDTAAALVAELDDEVVVIDELPRYHVLGCRALSAHPVIPLPAREAVELGFTPCGWCTPDRTFFRQHQAAARY